MNKINILQIGKADWNKLYQIPDNIDLKFYSDEDIDYLKLYDLVILDMDINYSEYMFLMKKTKAHCLYVTENVLMFQYSKRLFEAKQGCYLYSEDVELFLEEEAKNFYASPYGEKFSPEFLTISHDFAGEISYSGNYNVKLSGDFGDEYSQIVSWKNNIPIFEGQCVDLFLEYEKKGEVEIRLKVFHFCKGSISEVQQIWEFSEDELREPVRIDNTKMAGPIFASVLAKGKGELRIVSLHDRYSRRNFGFFLPGGDRYVTSKGEELFCYFDPGDMKPPLSIYFSGYRKQEGFEGYHMMRSLGCPYLLLTDPRLDGGAFYIGDHEYESLVTEAIKKYIRLSGLKEKQVIMSGNSMGTFGALYYGCDIMPHALILGKPLVNIGSVALNERIKRPGVFPTSLDVFLKNYKEITPENVQKFNQYFWNKFDYTNWGNTKFIISYLYEDDYDPNGYPDLLSHLKTEGVQVYGKGIHGRHNDNTSEVIAWFKSQYIKVLSEDFGRKNIKR